MPQLELVAHTSLRAGECGTCTALIAATHDGRVVSADLPQTGGASTEQAALDAGGERVDDGVEGPNSL